MSDRIDLIVLGRKIGTCDGWDSVDELAHVYYDFIPIIGLSIPDGDLRVLYSDGKFETYADEGDVIFAADIIDTIKHLEVVQ